MSKDRSTEIRALFDALGRDRLGAALGVSPQAIANVVGRGGMIPPAWFLTMDKLCGEDGIETPVDLFAWRATPSGQDSLGVCPDGSAHQQDAGLATTLSKMQCTAQPERAANKSRQVTSSSGGAQ